MRHGRICPMSSVTSLQVNMTSVRRMGVSKYDG